MLIISNIKTKKQTKRICDKAILTFDTTMGSSIISDFRQSMKEK